MSIIDVLDQDVFWIGQDGLRHELVEMDQEYRLNLEAYLIRNATRLARQRDRLLYERELLTSEDVNKLYPSPEAWIRGTPFYRALKVAIAMHDCLDGEVVNVQEGEPSQLELARRLLERREKGRR